MAGSFTDYLENRLLDHFYGGAASVAPVIVYLGLSTTAINDDGTGITEPVGGSYARITVTNNATNWPAASGGAKSNGVAFTTATATGSWGTITHAFFSDASSGGNILCHWDLPTSKTIASGDSLSFGVGAITLTQT